MSTSAQLYRLQRIVEARFLRPGIYEVREDGPPLWEGLNAVHRALQRAVCEHAAEWGDPCACGSDGLRDALEREGWPVD